MGEGAEGAEVEGDGVVGVGGPLEAAFLLRGFFGFAVQDLVGVQGYLGFDLAVDEVEEA